MKPSDIPAPLEAVEQAAFIVWCGIETNRIKYPGLKNIFAIPNGEKRDKATAGKLKAQGVLPGVCDMFLPVIKDIPDSEFNSLHVYYVYHGLFIEMKRVKGSRTPKEQKEFMADMIEMGYKVIVAKGCNEAIQAIKDYYA